MKKDIKNSIETITVGFRIKKITSRVF